MNPCIPLGLLFVLLESVSLLLREEGLRQSLLWTGRFLALQLFLRTVLEAFA